MRLLFFRFTMSKSLLSKKVYYAFNILAWCYSIAWLSCLLFVWYYWETTLWIKIALNLVLIVVTPSLSDLTKSYGQYKKEWQ